jgi:amino acid adenylation domain-containing protein
MTPDQSRLAERLARLPPDKREVLRKLMQAPRTEAISRRRPDERVPLTPGQQRLWLLDQLTPANPAYNESNFLRFPNAIDVEALRRALNTIVRRHEILRTTFPVIAEEPVQQVAPALTLDIPLIDLRQLPGAAREEEAMRRAAEEARRPFDLVRGPLLRAAIYRLDAADHILALTMHHIVCDGWSMGVIDVELFALYFSEVVGRPSPLPELAIQYGDYAVWLKHATAGATLARQLAYWRRQLADVPVLELPADRPRPPVFSFRGGRQPLVISGERYRALLRLGERENVTLFLVLLSAFCILLSRHTGDDDIAVGSPTAGRSHKECEPLIGFFVNTLVLRADLSGDPTVADLLARMRSVLQAALANQDLPFERVVQELQPARDKSRNPLFQVSFQLFQAPGGEGIDKTVLLPFQPLPTGIAKFDLNAQLVWTGSDVKGHIDYSSDLFDAPRIARLAGHFGCLLDAMATDPGQRISALPMLTAEEARQLAAWNATAVDYPHDSSIPEVFAKVAAAHAQAPAVRFGDQTLTYRALQRRAEAVARALAARGIGRGDPVGVFMERSLALPITLLAILKAGAAFVPLEPSYPLARLAGMLEDSGARIAVTSAGLAPRLAGIPAEIVTIEALEAAGKAAGKAAGAPRVAPGPDDLAYLMYTSGTTGRPKGVAVTHRNILRTVTGTSYVRLGPGCAVLQFAPISFDGSTFEIWGPLLNGGVLMLHPPGLPTLEELGAFIRDARIDVMFLTTGLFRQLIETSPGDLRGVRQLMFGGEAMAVTTARAAWSALPRSEVSNIYGPTECTTFATSFPITDPDGLGAVMPIGGPIGNTTAHVLDRRGRPLPAGIPGELFLGGDGVARGYWRRPALTAERFVPDPFSATPGARLYRTGDIAAWRDDGALVFFGRGDRQIKFNGYRIELGEIEATLEAHADISASAVLRAADGSRLIGFVAPRPGRVPEAAALRRFLAERLPPHMVPAQIELRERLPLTPVGKLDRDALAATVAAVTGSGRANERPRNAVEAAIAAIWEDLLPAREIGIADSFFDLGGHSLVATRLLSRLRDHFSAEVTMRQFFDDPTIAGLAEAIAEARSRP